MPISIGLTGGPLACSSRLTARPSQNCTEWNAELHTVGALRPPFCPCTPIDVGRWSSPPSITLWQEKQEIVPSEENRGSKNSILPNSTLADVLGLSAGSGARLGSGCQGDWAQAPVATAPSSRIRVRSGTRMGSTPRDRRRGRRQERVSIARLKASSRPGSAGVRHRTEEGEYRPSRIVGRSFRPWPPPQPAGLTPRFWITRSKKLGPSSNSGLLSNSGVCARARAR
jgi:hypothetical protein